MLLHVSIVAIVCSFLLVRSIPLFEYNHNLSIYLLRDIWIVFSFLPVTEKAAMNIHVQVIVWIYAFFSLG